MLEYKAIGDRHVVRAFQDINTDAGSAIEA
jgi:hypothetical protein